MQLFSAVLNLLCIAELYDNIHRNEYKTYEKQPIFPWSAD